VVVVLWVVAGLLFVVILAGMDMVWVPPVEGALSKHGGAAGLRCRRNGLGRLVAIGDVALA
jgi:hypothetical protein